MKQNRMFFDIETGVNESMLAFVNQPKAPANLKDPVKIQAAIEEKMAEIVSNAALDPDLGKILSIAYATNEDGPVIAHAVGEVYWAEMVYDHPENEEPSVIEWAYTERDLLSGFWKVFVQCNGLSVGYNLIGFDIPFIMRRSMALGVKTPCVPNLAKFRTEPITDLMPILYNWEFGKWKGLKQVAKLYGLPVETPDVDGSMVKNMTEKELLAYNVSDVKLTIALYKLMNGIYFNHQ
jgi:DNA polymerase elongation subunit (family B)